MTSQADAAEHVDLEEAPPVVIGDLIEGLGLEDAEIVYQDIDRRELSNHLGRPGFGSKISSDAMRGSAFLHSFIDARLGSAVHDHPRALLHQGLRDSESDTGC